MAELRFEGIFELEKALKEAATLDDVKETVRVNGAEMENRMKRNAKFVRGYSIGDTKRSIELRVSDGGYTATVGPRTDYAPYVEYGTRKMSAQPFVKPTHDAQKRKFINDMNRLMK